MSLKSFFDKHNYESNASRTCFFEGDGPLARGTVLINSEESTCEIICERSDKFEITGRFEEPASSFFVRYFDRFGEPAGRSAMRIGVHLSLIHI